MPLFRVIEFQYIHAYSSTLMKRNFSIFFLLLAFVIFPASAQLPFADEIRDFKRQDSLRFPPKNEILFVGSSSFRMWNNLESYFPSYKVINRGFGGSNLTDVIRYADDIIFPYAPRQVVIYCGENDLASGATVEQVVSRFIELYGMIRTKLPKAQIAFVSIKPSPSRMSIFESVKTANASIKSFLEKKRKAVYIDVFTPMLDSTGQPIKDIFLQDSLHMNSKGYAIWKEEIEPVLIKQKRKVSSSS